MNRKNRNKLAGACLTVIGLAAILSGLYRVFTLQAFAAIWPSDPEVFLPFCGRIVVGAVCIFIAWKFIHVRHERFINPFTVLLLFPASLAVIYAVILSFLIVGEPLYGETKTLNLEVIWEYNPDRSLIFYQFVGYGPFSIAIQPQHGLLEHLHAIGGKQVMLKIKAIYDQQGQVTRYMIKELAGLELTNQKYQTGYYLPESVGGKTKRQIDYEPRIGLAEKIADKELGLAIKNKNLDIGSKIYIVTLEKPQSLALALISEPLAKSFWQNTNMSEGEFYYRMKLVDGEINGHTPAIAVVNPLSEFEADARNMSCDIERDGLPEFFRVCTSSEGLHFTVWSTKPPTGQRRWHRYFHLGYEVEPDCTEEDYDN